MNEVPKDPDWESEPPGAEPSPRLWRRWLGALRRAFNAPFRLLKPYVPRGLFPRSLVLVVTPIVLLQLSVTYIFFDRHYQLVTRLLSSSVAGDIAAVLVLYDHDPKPTTISSLHDAFFKTMSLDIRFVQNANLPPPVQHGPIDVLDGVINKELARQIHRPYWFNTHRRNNVDIRVQLPGGVMRILVRRSRVLATNWHIFLVWMMLSSILILTVAIGFLRIQVRTITRLAQAAEAFGRGRDLPDFHPAGAREVRAAARALIDMRNRLARHVDQRTDMLAGISHDMRTPLTRIRLQLELLPPSPDVDAMKADLAEIEHMLDEYLAFARGEGSEDVAPADIAALVEETAGDAERHGRHVDVVIDEGARQTLATVPVRRGALKRCVTNLLDNALTYGTRARLSLRAGQRFFEIAVEDDGPGIAPEDYEEAFRPFRRLDTGLRSGIPGSGLGLAISRDLARSHGGEIHLSKSALGGLKASVRLPI